MLPEVKSLEAVLTGNDVSHKTGSDMTGSVGFPHFFFGFPPFFLTRVVVQNVVQ